MKKGGKNQDKKNFNNRQFTKADWNRFLRHMICEWAKTET